MEWRKVEGYDGRYEVSDTGVVKNAESGRELKIKKNNRGYVQIRLYKGGEVEHWLLHRLVAICFIDNPKGLPQINHKDEDKENNNANNLEWCTNLYNRRYGTGYQKSVDNHDYKEIGRKNSRPIKQYDKEGNLLTIHYGVKEAERQTGISESNIRKSMREKYYAGGYRWEYVL